MFYIGIFIISWIVAGFIASVPDLLDKDFYRDNKERLEEAGLPEPKHPKLFWSSVCMLFGYYSLYRELKSQLTNLPGR